MYILTVLKANVKHKKGVFLGIVLLMIIISMSLTVVLNVQENCVRSIENAHDLAGTGNFMVTIGGRQFTQDLKNSVENHEMVDRVVDYHAIVSDKEILKDYENNNSWMIIKLRDSVKLLNERLNGYEDTTPALKRGEIYVTQGILNTMNGKIGDKIKVTTLGGEYELTIKGAVLEPICGASVMGWKIVYISDEDFETMYHEAKAAETETTIGDAHVLLVYQDKDSHLSTSKFMRQVNLDTGIVDKGYSALTREMSIYYTNLFPKVMSSILIVFIILLFIITLIVMGHSISTAIEMEYVSLGVLKAQGFDNGKIRIIYMLQYVLAELIGAVIGIILAMPVIPNVVEVFQPITSIVAENKLYFMSFAVIAAILALSVIYVFLITRKIGKIAPVRAIQGGKNEIYFDSRLNVPVSKKLLQISLAFRQFTSAKRRYAAVIVIVAILIYFLLTVNGLGSALSSKTALSAMGSDLSEIDIIIKEKLTEEQYEAIENTVENVTHIESKYYRTNQYFSLNGEKIMGIVNKNSDTIHVIKGRAPIYDNEIVITEIVEREMNLHVGDEVTVKFRDKKDTYIITGTFQHMNDAGKNFSLLLTGAQRIGAGGLHYGGYCLKEPEKAQEVAEFLNERFGDLISADVVTEEELADANYSDAVNLIKVIVYSFSVVFVLVVVYMVCHRAILQEKSNIGIYKSQGFDVYKLRLQFAVRFLIVAIAGSAIGSVLSVLFSVRLLNMLLREIGISRFTIVYSFDVFAVPIGMVCVCFFVFAYAVSGKIKKVGLNELAAD